MNAKDTQNNPLEGRLRKAHLSEPPPHLKEWIIASAKKAWNQAPLELTWVIPFRYLVASAAAAVVIIWLADYSSDRTLARWSSWAIHATNQQLTDNEALPETPYGPFVRRLTFRDRRPSAIDTSALTDHAEALRRILDEAPQGGVAKPPAPGGGASRLILDQPSAHSYS